jgi:DNA-directed RNA polymerase subunit RPC12/RpoP
VRFSCERCGKRYATAAPPTPGRTYKLRCKACGHLIVVPVLAAEPVAPARAETPAPGGARRLGVPRSPPEPVSPPFPLEAGAPQAEPPPAPEPARTPPPSRDASSIVTMPPPAPETPALTPPPGEAGYVDLFSDLVEPAGREAKEDDLAAPRASPGNGPGPVPGARAPDPFRLDREPPPERTPARAVRAPLPATRVPVIPRPPRQRSTVPLVMMGIGVLLLVGILAFVMLSSGTRASAGPTRPEAAPPAAGEAAAPSAPEREPAPPAAAEPPPGEAGAAERRAGAAAPAGKARREPRERAARPPSTTSR